MVKPLLVANIIEEARWGGPQKRMVMVARGLKEHGVETVVMMPAKDSEKFVAELRGAGVAFEPLPLSVIGRGLSAIVSYLLYFFVDIFRIYSSLKTRPFDLVHVSGAWQIRGAIAARLAGVPLVWHLNDTAPPPAVAGLFSLLAPLLCNAVFLAAYRCARRYLIFPRVAHLRRFSVPAPVDVSQFVSAETTADPRISGLPGCRIVTLSNINPIKGIELLLDSAKVLRAEGFEFSVAVVGPVYSSQTEYSGRLKERVIALGLSDCVHFLGASDNVATCLAAADIYACSSVAEASPMSVWEAMAMGLPIVSTDVGDVSCYIESGCSGLVVEPGNVKAFSGALRKLILNPELRARFGAAARESVRTHLDLPVVVKKTNLGYRETLAGVVGRQPALPGSGLSCIAVEALSAVKGGGQTYLRHLLGGHDFREGERVVVIVPRSHLDVFPEVPGVEYVAPSFPEGSLIHRFAWYRFALPHLLKKLGVNVLYCPGGLLSARMDGVRTAVASQNMLTFSPREMARFPFGYVRMRLQLLAGLQRTAFRKADLLIFISAFAQQVVNAALPDRKGASVVVPHGVGRDFRERADVPEGVVLPESYVLYVSILDYYKAQLEVVDAWGQLQRIRPSTEKLLLVGPTDSSYAELVRQRIASLGLSDSIAVVGAVPYETLPAIYQHARINIFASSCENCPNILLEALAAGKATLCSNYQPMPEFGGDAVRYFDPYAPRELAELLAEMLDSPEALASWGEKAYSQSLKFQWETSARLTWSALRELASPKQ